MSQHHLNIADIRNDYRLAGLDEHVAGSEPFAFFKKWFKEAEECKVTEINAMTLATVDAQNHPHARIVLLKGVDSRGFVFFTNYQSAKGHNLDINPHAALVFFWKELERQVRIEGMVEKTSPEESDAYFHSRPAGSRLGAWASPQSQKIDSRHTLDLNYAQYEREFLEKDIARPPYWGGYRLLPTCVEFWQGRASRMHDRILFSRNDAGAWDRSRLAP